MSFIRKRYYLLEATIFAAWGLLIGGTVGIIAGFDPKYTFIENVAMGLFLGILVWMSWRGWGRFLWSTGWYRWVLAVLSCGLLPLELLLLDLNAKYIVSRYYRGDKPIPYTFLS